MLHPHPGSRRDCVLAVCLMALVVEAAIDEMSGGAIVDEQLLHWKTGILGQGLFSGIEVRQAMIRQHQRYEAICSSIKP